MGAFIFDKCCFCIELKTGCFIIAYLSLIGYSILTLLGVIALIGGAVISTQHETTVHQTTADDIFSGGKFPVQDDSNQVAGIAIMLLAGLFLLIIAFLLTFIIVLLVGLHKNKPGHVKAYLIYSCIFIVISIVGLIASAFNADQRALLGQSIFNILWNIYITLVIRSQYFAMRSPERGPAIYSAA